MSFTAKDVQLLRERTGVGMMDCKKALVEADGDMDKAINILREKGLAAAAKKSGRLAAEGMVYAYVDADRKVGSMVEVNSETDFVAKNQEFQAFVKKVAQVVTEKNPSDLDALLKTEFENGQTVMETLREKILVVGENLSIRRCEVRARSYHTCTAKGVSAFWSGLKPLMALIDVLNECGRISQCRLQPSTPYLDKTCPQGDIEKEENLTQIKNDQKREQTRMIIEKMVEGRLGKFYENNCLLNQASKTTDYGRAVGEDVRESRGEIKVASLSALKKTKGSKREDNFADEVASMIK